MNVRYSVSNLLNKLINSFPWLSTINQSQVLFQIEYRKNRFYSTNGLLYFMNFHEDFHWEHEDVEILIQVIKHSLL